MKKRIFSFVLLGLLGSLLFIVAGFNDTKNFHWNISANENTLNVFHENQGELLEGNEKKFGRDIGDSKLNLHITDLNEVNSTDSSTTYDALMKGVIKAPNGNFNFDGEGRIHKLKLSTGKEIYSADLEGIVKNKAGQEPFTISLKFEPSTKKIDVTLVSGLFGETETSVIPFGEPFLLVEELEEIQQMITE